MSENENDLQGLLIAKADDGKYYVLLDDYITLLNLNNLLRETLKKYQEEEKKNNE